MHMLRRIVLVTTIFLTLALFSGCESDNAIVKYIFGEFPRIVYIANVDTRLDLYGATVVSINRNGYPVSTVPLETARRITVEHAVDFTTPGIYEVTIVLHRREHLNFTFLVQVINEEIFNELKSGAN